MRHDSRAFWRLAQPSAKLVRLNLHFIPDSASPEGSLKIHSNGVRVRAAVAMYLLCVVGLNVFVWTWFVVHYHAWHRFPLGDRVERFGDLLRFSGKFQYGKDRHMTDSGHLIGTLFPKNYLPFAVVIYLFLLQVCAPYALWVFLATLAAGFGAASALLWRRVHNLPDYRWYIGASIFLTGLFGWGTLQVAERGNIEGIMWIAVCFGAALYAQGKFRGAGAAFGVACCIKPFPVLWFGLMARHKKFRGIGWGVLTAAALTLASLEVIDRNPFRAYRHIVGHDTFFQDYIVAFRPMEEMMGDHSLFQTIKTIARVIRNHGLHFSYIEYWEQANDPRAWKLYHAYLPLAVILGLLTLWLTWKKPVLNQIFALACVTTVLPLLAGDYTLTVLYIPMGFFLIFLLEDVAQGRARMTMGQMLCFLLPCAWIMACNPLWELHGVLKCAAILILLGASLTIPLPSTVLGELEPNQAPDRTARSSDSRPRRPHFTGSESGASDYP